VNGSNTTTYIREGDSDSMVRATITFTLEYPNDAPMSILESEADDMQQALQDEYEVEVDSSVCFN